MSDNIKGAVLDIIREELAGYENEKSYNDHLLSDDKIDAATHTSKDQFCMHAIEALIRAGDAINARIDN